MAQSSDQLASLARRFRELIDSNDWDAAEKHVDASAKAHVGSQHLDKRAWLEMGKMFHGAFPDASHRIERQVANADTVVTIALWSGTHLGDFMGMSATGRKVSMPLIVVDRVENGLIVEHWGQFDSAGLMQQLTQH
jgi:steroid delta-isomerase-like uncharacterized protein